MNFPATLILREVNFGCFLKVKNYHFNNFGGSNLNFWKNFTLESGKKIPHIQNSELLKWSKWQFMRLQKDQN